MYLVKYIGLLLLSSGIAVAQTSNLTATITDSDGQTWNNGKVSIQFNPNPNYPNINSYTIISTGAKIDRNTANKRDISLNGSGLFTTVIYDNTLIQPAGSSYTFTICSKTSAPCSTVPNIQVFGASPNYSSTLSPLVSAPRFPATGANAFGYLDVEVSPAPLSGGSYFNVSDLATHQWNGTAWVVISAGGGPPAGCTKAVQNNAGGSTFGGDCNVQLDTTAHTVDVINGSNGSISGPVIGGSYFASHYQTTVGSNDGILNSLGNNKIVTADQTYTGETSLNWFNWAFANAKNYRLHREFSSSQIVDFFHDWTPASPTFGDGSNSAHSYIFMDDVNTAFSIHKQGMTLAYYDTSPGYNSGTPVTGASGWQTTLNLSMPHNISGRGLSESITSTLSKAGVGDSATLYMYDNYTGGWVEGAGEGVKAGAFQTNEVNCAPRGTVTSIVSSVSLKASMTQDGGCIGDGKPVINLNQGGSLDVAPFSGTITNMTNGSTGGSGFTTFTLSGTVPQSICWGTLNSNVNTPVNSTFPYRTSMTFNITLTSGTCDNTHLLCIGSNQHDCDIPTNAGTPSGSVQSITMPLQYGHVSGSPMAQGGMTGYALELPYYDVLSNSRKIRWMLDVTASKTTSSVDAILWKQGTAQGFGNGVVSNDIFKSIPLTTCSNSGTTTVTCTYNNTNMPTSERYNAATVLISGASDSAFNTFCTNIAFTGGNTSTCTIAGLSGTHTAVSASAVPVNPSFNFPINAYNMWTAAEMIDVQDYAANPIVVDGAMLLSPGTLSPNIGDVLENPNHASLAMNGLTVASNPLNPYIQVGTGIAVTGQGQGVTGTYVLGSFTNNNGDALYQSFGGGAMPPQGLVLNGFFSNMLKANHLPYAFGSGGAVIDIPSIPATQQNDQNLNAGIMFIAGKTGNYQANWAPFTNTLTETTTGPHVFNASAHTFTTGPVTISTVLHVNGAGAVGATNEVQIDRSGGVGRLWAFGNDATHYAGWQLNSQPGNTATTFTWFNCPIYVVGATIPSCDWGSPLSIAGQTSGKWTMKAAAATTNYTSTAPAAVCSINQVWQTVDAAGTWGCVTPTGAGLANTTLTVPITTVNANSCTADTTVTVTGLATTNTISYNWGSATESGVAGWDQSVSTGAVSLQIRPSSVNTESWHLCNNTGANITTASYTFNVSYR